MKHSYLKIEFNETKKSKSKSHTTRVWQLFAQNKNSKALKEHEVELIGIPDMVNGLEYHYKKFQQLENTQRRHLQNKFNTQMLYPTTNNAIHEAVAYLNRVGQLHTLLTSKWFKNYISEAELSQLCPTLLAVMPLRNKHTSHRSIDDPINEDDYKQAFAASIPLIVTWQGKSSLERGKIDVSTSNICYSLQISRHAPKNRSLILTKHHANPVSEVEIFTDETIFIHFILTLHHSRIMTEIMNVLKKIF